MVCTVFLLSLFSHLFFLVSADSSSPNGASIFNLPVKQNSNYTFALNIPDDSAQLYLHLSGPTDYSWLAVGTGSEMKNSLMFIVYANAKGDNITVSPRLSSGEQEPRYSSSIAFDILEGTGIANNSMTLNARCSNCTSWATGSLDLKSTAQSWIFGLGPVGGQVASLRSNSPAANLERHSKYGSFTMNMVQATGGSGGLPTSYSTATGSALDGGVTTDSSWPTVIHAVCACVGLILLTPLGVVFLRILPASVRWHWVNQSLAATLGIVGIMVGLYLSTMFNKSQDYSSSHQILGIVILILVIAQWSMGLWHHRIFQRSQTPTQIGPVHRYVGYVVLLLAIINGGIGLTWSSASTGTVLGYSITVLVIGLGTVAVFGWARVNAMRNQKQYTSSPYELGRTQGGRGLDSNYLLRHLHRDGSQNHDYSHYGQL
ncbi:uncharacterized protein N7459_003243 [Penicillium hispanicum]|uniref:uncharacterized protein n=1 Tax=Penicillium hispanicum TaxID=1080232 RepID=UPI0025407C04|nr:uncharacterized protein N7459_003243 [Penicillium hispanicum]KAJ5587478.1 hypothetical protein N7459_003243 [Penicillium hispanicum]